MNLTENAHLERRETDTNLDSSNAVSNDGEWLLQAPHPRLMSPSLSAASDFDQFLRPNGSRLDTIIGRFSTGGEQTSATDVGSIADGGHRTRKLSSMLPPINQTPFLTVSQPQSGPHCVEATEPNSDFPPSLISQTSSIHDPSHDSNQTHNNQINVATYLPSSKRTSKFIFHEPEPLKSDDIISEHDRKMNIESAESNSTNQPNNEQHTAYNHRKQPQQQDHRPEPTTNHHQTLPPNAHPPTNQKPHRRVASAKTSREQAHEQARSRNKREAAIAAVKKQLNFGVAQITSQHVLENAQGNTLSTVFDEKEMRRILAIHGMRLMNGPKESRFDSITSIACKLLSVETSALTIVDSSLIRYLSITDTTNGKFFPISALQDPSSFNEARGESFCQYTIRDSGATTATTGTVEEKTNHGFVVLDANREPKFQNRTLVLKGLHFYAGAPLITKSGIKIGALSVRGTARLQFTSQEAKILRQLTEWAIAELELYIAKRDLDFRESLRLADVRLGHVRDRVLAGVSDGSQEWNATGRSVLKQCLEIIKSTLKLKNAMLLKIKKNSEGAIRSIVFALAEACDVKLGDEKFTELCQSTLDKPSGSAPYILDRKHYVASQLQVCRFIGEHVRQSASELIWSHGRPVGVLALFFEGIYKTVSPLEEQFLTSCAIIISSIWQHMETHDSLSKAMNPTSNAQLIISRLKGYSAANSGKPFAVTSKKSTASSSSGTLMGHSNMSIDKPHFQTAGIPIAVLICEPVIPAINGNTVSEECYKATESKHNQTLLGMSGFQYPQSSQQNLLQSNSCRFSLPNQKSNNMERIHRNSSSNKPNRHHRRRKSTASGQSKKDFQRQSMDVECKPGIWGGTSASVSLTARGAIDLLADFSQMFDVVAEQQNIRVVKKQGNLFVAVTGLTENSSASCDDLINLARDLCQTLTEYAQETRVNVTVRIRMHGDFIPTTVADYLDAAENAWTRIINFAYQLEYKPNLMIQLSEFVYMNSKQTELCSVLGTRFMSGFGAVKIYKLSLSETEKRESESMSTLVGQREFESATAAVAASGLLDDEVHPSNSGLVLNRKSSRWMSSWSFGSLWSAGSRKRVRPSEISDKNIRDRGSCAVM